MKGGKEKFNPSTDLTEGMRVKKKSDGMFATDVYRFYEYTSGLGPNGERSAKIRNEQTLKEEVADANNLKKLMFETVSGKSGGKRKTRKGRKMRKSKKSRKSRKTKKSKKSRKSRKSRK